MSQSLAPQAAGYFLSLYDPDSALHTQYHADGDLKFTRRIAKGTVSICLFFATVSITPVMLSTVLPRRL